MGNFCFGHWKALRDQIFGSSGWRHSAFYFAQKTLEHFEKIGFTNIDAIPCEPNDDNYDLNPNIAYIYVYDDGQIYNQLRINQAIGINGHIESKWGQKIIVDVLSFIKEKETN